MDKKYQDGDEDESFLDYYKLSVNDYEQKELEKKLIECCVAYIDIIGFKAMIDEDSHLPILALRFIKKFINVFYNSLNDHGKKDYTDEESDDDALPKATMFSDSIVISQPITEVDYPLFIDLIAQLQYGLFCKGILIRGGICCGELYHDENYLFGKGLIKAYLLESERADYPRIVVDTNLINKIHEIVDQRFDESWRSYIIVDNGERNYQNGLNNDEGDYSIYIRKDFDNEMYINYFIKFIEYCFMDFDIEPSKENLKNLLDHSELHYVKKFIEEGLKNKDHHILTKYEWLRKLYNSSIREAFIKRKIEHMEKTLNRFLIQ